MQSGPQIRHNPPAVHLLHINMFKFSFGDPSTATHAAAEAGEQQQTALPSIPAEEVLASEVGATPSKHAPAGACFPPPLLLAAAAACRCPTCAPLPLHMHSIVQGRPIGAQDTVDISPELSLIKVCACVKLCSRCCSPRPMPSIPLQPRHLHYPPLPARHTGCGEQCAGGDVAIRQQGGSQ